eukprot:10002077-Alexandrium_andersonii.AAC.1
MLQVSFPGYKLELRMHSSQLALVVLDRRPPQVLMPPRALVAGLGIGVAALHAAIGGVGIGTAPLAAPHVALEHGDTT